VLTGLWFEIERPTLIFNSLCVGACAYVHAFFHTSHKIVKG
jgi:hypothetical protein